MPLLRLQPLDTLFFRDGRPYNQKETTQIAVPSLFPPSPPTVVGAVRAAAARALGWEGRGNWGPEIERHLGDRQGLGPLSFRGPYVLRNGRPLFPAPAHLVGRRRGEGDEVTFEDLALLRPGPRRNCDLGREVQLPVPPAPTDGEGGGSLKSCWVTRGGLSRILAGAVPEPGELVDWNELWCLEPRVGIERDYERHTTGEAALYSPLHVRLRRGVTLALHVDGLSREALAALTETPVPLGGESRACWVDIDEEGHGDLLPASPELEVTGDAVRYIAVILSPLPADEPPMPGMRYLDLPGRIVSACLPRPQLWGGWDGLDRRPRPLKPHVAPGSVLFLEAGVEELPRIRALHGKSVAPTELRPWGFGIVAVGRWPKDEPTTGKENPQ